MTEQERQQSMANANESSHYVLILVGTIICILGTYLRFAIDATWLSIVSWVILFVGAIIACKGVFKIMSGGK